MADREKKQVYIAIDLKSFYASVECTVRGLNPLTTNLVVADTARTEKTICLAVSPSLKAYGIPGRARLFEVVQKVNKANALRRCLAPGGEFSGKSTDDTELKEHTELAIDYIAAPPQMAYYMACSKKIYEIYLKYVAKEDIHVYSIDEVFIDAGQYLTIYQMNAEEFTRKLIKEILAETGITATAGIGTNLYLCKIAMDIVAKHMPADENGVRIAKLDEMSYRKLLWNHKPLTDFWRVGRGYAKKLEACGLVTMGDIARCSIGKPNEFYNEDLLYRMFGVNAELLIDHAWGYEPVTIAEIKAYEPENHSLCSGQVLQRPYKKQEARIVVQEMTERLALDLVEQGLVCDQLMLTICYDVENLMDPEIKKWYRGEITTDGYGRKVPKYSHGTTNLKKKMSSAHFMTEGIVALFDQIVGEKLLVRKIYLTANHVGKEQEMKAEPVIQYEQLDLFTDYEALEKQKKQEEKELEKERNVQKAMLSIEKKYGKNAILKGINFRDGATQRSRNGQIGGHKA